MARTLNLKLPKFPCLPVDGADGLRVVLRPIFWLVLGLHAFLLFAPLNQPPKPKPPQDKKAPVRITQLPNSKPGAKPLSKEELLKQAQATLAKVSNPTPSTVQVAKKEPLPIPPQQLREAIALTRSPDQPAPPNEGPAVPGEPFPHYPGSQPGCYGKDACRTANASRETVAAFFEKELPAKKWEITPAPDEGDAKVYVVVSKSGSQYLSLLVDSGKTIYVLGSAPVPNIAALKDSIEPPGLYYEVISALAVASNPTGDESQTPTQPRKTQFAQPEFFYANSESADPDAAPDKPGTDAAKLIYGQPPDAVLAQIRGQAASVLQISPVGSYGGGSLYQMQPKNGKPLFLSLVSTSAGTILVTWLQDPR